MKSMKPRKTLRTKELLLFTAVIFLFLVIPLLAVITTGAEAPNLKLPDIENVPFDLSSLKGKKIILNFWSSWSEPSLRELIYFGKNYEFFKSRDYQIISINLDQRPAVAKFFAERWQIPFLVLVDLHLVSIDKFKLLVVPTTFIIDENFKIQKILVNFDESVIRALKEITKV